MEETILSKLHSEHEEIEHDLNLILRTADECVKQELFEKVKKKLIEHMEGVNDSIYRHFREDILGGENLQFILMSDSEHHCVKEYLQRLNLLSIKSLRWDETLEELLRIIKNHIKDEEDEMFSEAKEDFSKDELIQFGMEFDEFKSHTH